MFRSINSVQLIFVLLPLLLLFRLSSGVLKSKTDESFENYVIDIFFTNALTIVRCNEYEQFVLKTMTMQSIGELHCGNTDQFLPSNHLEQIALFEWKGTQGKCAKKDNKTIEETTIFQTVHKAKNALKKHPLKLLRVGSSKSTQGEEQKHQFYFKHAARAIEIKPEENYTTNIYSLRHRPILCREKYLTPTSPCDPKETRKEFSYFCYYRVGVKEPPTIADMEKEWARLSKEVDLNKISPSGHYSNRKPKEKKKPMDRWLIGGVILVALVIVTSGCIWYCCGDSESDGHGKKQADSDTSISSKDS